MRRQIDARLKLASYKIETNQIDVPVERLTRFTLPPRCPSRFSAGLAPGDRTGRVSGVPPDVLRAVVRRMEGRARAAMNRAECLATVASTGCPVKERRGPVKEESETADELPRLPAPRSKQRTPFPDRPVTPKRNRSQDEIHLSSSARGAASLLSLRRS